MDAMAEKVGWLFLESFLAGSSLVIVFIPLCFVLLDCVISLSGAVFSSSNSSPSLLTAFHGQIRLGWLPVSLSQ